MLLHVPIQGLRGWLGTAGNKQERAVFMAGFLGLSVWTVLVTGYFMLLQTCTLWLETLLAGAALCLALLEALDGGLSGSLFCDGFWEFGLVFLGFGASGAALALLLCPCTSDMDAVNWTWQAVCPAKASVADAGLRLQKKKANCAQVGERFDGSSMTGSVTFFKWLPAFCRSRAQRDVHHSLQESDGCALWKLINK
ncbi:unnamed protein product, partial [Effrenium voratum]